jgi:aquaporin Z
MLRRFLAELIGTFWLVYGGCGSAIFASYSIGSLGVALTFGLTLITMAYAIAPISGCHLNPAVSLGLWVARRIPHRILLPYIVAQVAGGILAGAALYLTAIGQPGFDLSHGFATNGYGDFSPAGFGLLSALFSETLLTAFFLFILLGATDRYSPRAMMPLAIGLSLTAIHLISMPITNTSINPARSTGVALVAGGHALQQLWLFWMAPLGGSVIGALAYLAVRRRSGAESK